MFVLGLLCLSCGACGTDLVSRTVPVKGMVTVNGQPLPQGSVVFWPDADKGNSSTFPAAAEIHKDGTYELITRGKPGAPPGAYKVTVMAQVPSDPNNPYSRAVELPD